MIHNLFWFRGGPNFEVRKSLWCLDLILQRGVENTLPPNFCTGRKKPSAFTKPRDTIKSELYQLWFWCSLTIPKDCRVFYSLCTKITPESRGKLQADWLWTTFFFCSTEDWTKMLKWFRTGRRLILKLVSIWEKWSLIGSWPIANMGDTVPDITDVDCWKSLFPYQNLLRFCLRLAGDSRQRWPDFCVAPRQSVLKTDYGNQALLHL